MNRKLKNTLVLAGVLILIAVAGSLITLVLQRGKIKDKTKKLEQLKLNSYDTKTLKEQLQLVKVKAAALDSILSSRKFNIPKMLTQTRFYDFVNSVSMGFSEDTHIDIEFADDKHQKDYNYLTYKVSGTGEFNDVYKLIYAIEQSRELKKINSNTLTTYVSVDDDGVQHYMVNFAFVVYVYYANDDRFTTANFVENNLGTGDLYNMFYPLIRNELPPNVDELLEVEGSKLLAMVSEGAYMADSKGNTYMLFEGDPVYLGYLTKIDYEKNRVTFILNKGGIIEKIYRELEKEENQKRRIK
ncbi:MAG: hypothetical protein ACM3SM_06765 [Bacteroidota bacterium]